MPLINHNPTSFDKELALLEAAGVQTTKGAKVEERFYAEMLNGGLSPEEIVGTIAGIMNGGESSSVKLAAAKIALSMHMHPAFVPRKESERSDSPSITINITGGDVKLQNILKPAPVQGQF